MATRFCDRPAGACGAADQVGGLLGDDHGRQIGVAARDPGDGRGVDDAQVVETADAQLVVDNGQFV